MCPNVITGWIGSSGKGIRRSSRMILTGSLREQGQFQVCNEIFKRTLSKIVDDPGRFCNEYLLFLSEEGSLQDLNAGYSAIHRVSTRLVHPDLAAVDRRRRKALHG